MTSIPTRKIEMSTEQKQDIHCGTCTVKGDMVACLATPCSVRSSWFANSQAAEIERLTGCLGKANIQAEKFEREWYLRGDENEALKAELLDYTEGKKVMIKEIYGAVICPECRSMHNAMKVQL